MYFAHRSDLLRRKRRLREYWQVVIAFVEVVGLDNYFVGVLVVPRSMRSLDMLGRRNVERQLFVRILALSSDHRWWIQCNCD